VKHGKSDQQHRILITGLALAELKRHASDMPESFGLDRKIERYQGKRPITLYRWDLECLLDTLDMVVKEPRGYPCDNSLEPGKRFRADKGDITGSCVLISNVLNGTAGYFSVVFAVLLPSV